VANDDNFMLEILKSMLGRLDFEVDEAENGLIAVQMYLETQRLVRENKGCGYDVIILDLDMPIMNGFEACERLRKDNQPLDLQALFMIDKATLFKKEVKMIDDNITVIEED
jgi:two-component system response regulator ResD